MNIIGKILQFIVESFVTNLMWETVSGEFM